MDGSNGKVKPEDPSFGGNDETVLWQQCYVITEHWSSDLLFFNDELGFFRKLIDRYFMWLVDERNIEGTRKVARDLSKLETKVSTIQAKLEHHRRCLFNLMENPFSHNAQDSKDDQYELEALLAAFAKEFRLVKQEVFRLTETVIESEKVKHLLNS